MTQTASRTSGGQVSNRLRKLSHGITPVVSAVLVWLGIGLIAGRTAHAQEVEVDPVSPVEEEVKPGNLFSLSVRVANRSDRDERFEEQIDLPDGWELLFPVEEFGLDAGNTTARQYQVRVPREYEAGTYRVQVGVQGVQTPEASDDATFSVTVLPNMNFTLFAEQPPDQVVGAGPYEVGFRVVNPGNVPVRVTFTVDDLDRARGVSVDPPRIEELPPGEQRTVTVTVDVADDLRKQHTHRVRLTATSRGINGTEITETASTEVQVFPREAGQDPFVRFPVNLTTRLGISNRGEGGQLELSGSGFLDDNESRHLDFLFREPDLSDQGITGLTRRNWYGISYDTPDYSVDLGDRRYELTRLTTGTRTGRGAGGAVRPGERIEMGAHYREDRFTTRDIEDVAGFLRGHPTENTSLGLAALHRRQTEDETPGGEVYSLEGSGQLFEGADELEAEVAVSDAGEVENDSAYHLRWFGEALGTYLSGTDRVRYNFRHERFGPDYFGRSRDREYSNANLRFPITGDLRAHANYIRLNRNLDRDPARGSARLEQHVRTGVSTNVTRNLRLRSELEWFSEEDRVSGGTLDNRERGLNINLNRHFNSATVRWDVTVARLEDRHEDERELAWESSLTTGVNPTRDLQLSASARYGNDGSISGRLVRERRDLSLRARWTALPNLDVDVSYRKRLWNLGDRETDRFQGQVFYELPNSHTVELDARHVEARGNRADRSSALVTYNVPFSVPLQRRETVGSVRGSLYTYEDGKRRPLPNTSLFTEDLGGVTDEEGKFVFHSLEPGKHTFDVDASDVGPGYVSRGTQHRTVNVEAGRVTDVTIEMIKAGAIEGTVQIHPPDTEGDRDVVQGGGMRGIGVSGTDNENQVQKVTGFADALVVIRQGDSVRRTTTDRDGHFRISSVTPGQWTVRVLDHNLPPYHELEQPTRQVKVKQGETSVVEFDISPVQREIEFVEEADVPQENQDTDDTVNEEDPEQDE